MDLTGTVERKEKGLGQAGSAAAVKNSSNAATLATVVAQEQAQLATISALAGQAQLALQVAGNTAGANTARDISSQASQSQGRLDALQVQISALQAQLASGGGSASQLQVLLQQEEVERQNANNLATQLNTLLNANRNVTGVPQGTVGLIGGPIFASASVPV